ncbi:MAG: energy transducer TonB [Syntrophaceae bacterium]|nr:energy transducer TonB [Syntrophaceae bacterium]
MERRSERTRRFTFLLMVASLVLAGLLCWLLFFHPPFRSSLDEEWQRLTREGKRILRWEKGEMSPEEKRIREEVILKKMREASALQDWRSYAPEYPRPRKLEPLPGEERDKALRNSPEFKELEKELKEYLRSKEGLLLDIEAPVPSPKDEAGDALYLRDKGAEKVIEGLLSRRGRAPQERPLEENSLLGIKGPLATRKILERPQTPQVKVRVEAEIELTFWVSPEGMVDRVIPTIRGDTELEWIAIQYLKQWRFAPLSKDQPQVEQWGVIPIKFKLQ